MDIERPKVGEKWLLKLNEVLFKAEIIRISEDNSFTFLLNYELWKNIDTITFNSFLITKTKILNWNINSKYLNQYGYWTAGERIWIRKSCLNCEKL